jgi:hypothetical protein
MSEEKPKPTIYFVKPEIKPPEGSFPGQFTDGAFTFVDDTVTICHPTTGEPVQDPQQGKFYTYKLPPPTTTFVDAEIHAKRLTKDFRLALRGKSDAPAGFGRRLNYNNKGIV